MSVPTYIYRIVVYNLLTLYYTIFAIILMVINYIRNPFADPWAQKLRLEPPAPLSDPKYGVHKYVKANGVKLHYVESGDASRPLMLFLHGFPEFWYSWRYQIEEFQKNYWCIAVDMRGYGDSEKPDGVSSYKIDLLIEDVRDLIRQLGREKCILISHDWGGLIACRFRDVHPDALDAIVMLASTSREAWFNQIWTNADQRSKSWYVFLHRMPAIPEYLLTMNDMDVFNKVMLVPGKNTVNLQDIECYKYWFGKPCALTPPVNYYRANFPFALPEKPQCDRNVPFLIGLAERDPYINHKNLDEMKAQYKHIETIIVEDCSHFLITEEPVKVNTLIKEFLAKHNL